MHVLKNGICEPCITYPPQEIFGIVVKVKFHHQLLRGVDAAVVTVQLVAQDLGDVPDLWESGECFVNLA